MIHIVSEAFNIYYPHFIQEATKCMLHTIQVRKEAVN